MNKTSRRVITGGVAIGLVLVAALGPCAAYAATPTQPVLKDCWVSGVGKVTLQWYASTDASGHAVSYDVYRDVIPVTASTISSRSLTPVVTSFSGTTVQINAAAQEPRESYTWFYAVVAKDDQSTPAKSAPSLNLAPNLHGYRFDTNLVACTRCHSAHGVYKIPYQNKESCYTCHGGTGSTAPLGAKSTFNTEASFYDTGTATPGSRHRNQYMTDTKQECAACHTPHRSPYYYNATGVYDAASSYRRMLRIEYATGQYAYYSRNSLPAQGNEFCFSCHGSSAVSWDSKTIDASAAIGIVGGPGAYANAGGDHNYSGYAAAAHGTGVIYSNDYDGSSATTDNPAVQCEACHHNHAAAADKLIDYRSSDTTDPTKWKQANLCYACHSASSTETSVAAGYTKPFAWNGRDVKAQFQRVSHHPTVARVGDPSVEPGIWTQTTQTEFGLDTLTNTTAVSGGSG
ncbi:MAG: cytochrome c3 family protein, partial [Coriobacteriales bacterium]